MWKNHKFSEKRLIFDSTPEAPKGETKNPEPEVDDFDELAAMNAAREKADAAAAARKTRAESGVDAEATSLPKTNPFQKKLDELVGALDKIDFGYTGGNSTIQDFIDSFPSTIEYLLNQDTELKTKLAELDPKEKEAALSMVAVIYQEPLKRLEPENDNTIYNKIYVRYTGNEVKVELNHGANTTRFNTSLFDIEDMEADLQTASDAIDRITKQKMGNLAKKWGIDAEELKRRANTGELSEKQFAEMTIAIAEIFGGGSLTEETRKVIEQNAKALYPKYKADSAAAEPTARAERSPATKAPGGPSAVAVPRAPGAPSTETTPFAAGTKIEGTDVDASVIKNAETECSKPTAKPAEVLKRKHFIKIVKVAAEKVGTPADAILAVMMKEVKFKFGADLKGPGGEMGMGQFHKPAWNVVKKDPAFKTIVGPMVSGGAANVERTQSLLADVVGIAVFLKRGAKVFDIRMDHTTKLEKKQLMKLRFYYHTPGYARIMKGGETKAKKRGKAEYYKKAIASYKKAEERYKRYAATAFKFREELAE